MSMKKEIKIQKILDATRAAEFFHTLGMAIALAGDPRLADLGLPLSAYEKIKLTIKKEGESFILKAKVKEVETAPTGEEPLGEQVPGQISYKTLKKRMKGSFAELKRALSLNATPSAETVRRFLDDSNLMITYPGFGDEHYEPYKRCCLEFGQAVASGDLEAMRNALVAVEARKKACHDQYK
jgi:XXXCH domain-containing protein